MIKHGARPVRLKHTDYDYLQSHKLGSVSAGDVQFADEYFADAGLTMPNQDLPDTEFVPPTPSMPYGCTDFAQAELATDLTHEIHNPLDLEALTGANAKGGMDIRVSLDACTPASAANPKRLGWFTQYFNIRTSGLLDYFDSFRIAQVMGVNVGEKRSITWCTPWFQSWEQAALSGVSVMPMPTSEELNAARYQPNTLPWHDSKLDGWSNNIAAAPGRLLYRNKSWQGSAIGDKGFIYFPREVINMVMSIGGTAAFTPTRQAPVSNPQPISLPTLQWIVSVILTILQRYLPSGVARALGII